MRAGCGLAEPGLLERRGESGGLDACGSLDEVRS